MRRQSEHIADYRGALDRLRGVGLVYPAFMSRAEIAAATADGLAARPRRRAALSRRPTATSTPPRRRARIAAASRYALRLRMATPRRWPGRCPGARKAAADGETGTIAAEPAAWGDVMLARKETPASYHLAVVVDDALQGVTDVVRGRDLFARPRSMSCCRSSRPARAGLPPPPADHRRRRAQAVQVRPRHLAALAPRGGQDAGRHPADGGGGRGAGGDGVRGRLWQARHLLSLGGRG